MFVWIGCGNSGEDEQPPEPLVCDDTWESFAHAYAETWCTSCHSSDLVGPEARYGAPDGFDFDTLEGMRAHQSEVFVWTAGDDPLMPPAGGVAVPLANRFSDWVQCGMLGEGTAPVSGCESAAPVAGDVSVLDADAATALCAGGYVSVEGSLTVSGDAALGCVCSVGGDLVVEGGAVDLVQEVNGVPVGLGSVGGDLVVRGAAAAVRAPELKGVGGSVRAEQVPELAELDVSELESVGGDLRVVDAPLLGALLLSRLATVPGELRVERTGVAALELSRVASTGGDLALVDLAGLVELRGNTGALKSVGGDLLFVRIPQWDAQYGFGVLQTVGGDLVFEDVDATVKLLGFTEIVSIGGSLRLVDNDAMSQYDAFDNLATVGGEVEVARNANLGLLDRLSALTTVGGALRIESNPKLALVTAGAKVTEVGGLTIDGATSTAMPVLSNLEKVHGDVRLSNVTAGTIAGQAVTTVTLPSTLQVVEGSVVIEDLPQLEGVVFEGVLLNRIEGDLIFRNTGLTALDVPFALKTVAGDLVIDGNDALTAVSALNGIDAVGGDLVVTGNTALPSASASALTAQFTVAGATTISNNGP